jgi:hypothetical protein
VAILLAERQRIFKLTLAHRWVVVAGLGGWAEATALRSYSVDNLAHF